jgi:thiol-disulfide isomerase/thioredoxin
VLLLYATILFGQEYKIIQDENLNESILIGISNKKVFQDSNFATWFNSEYTNYNVDTKTLENYKNSFEDKIIKTVLGTWCSDSRREVPRFVKILDFIGFPEDKHLFYNVDRNKKGLMDEVDNLDVDFVPTIIIYENGKELGRIIEAPEVSLEADLVKIIKKNS